MPAAKQPVGLAGYADNDATTNAFMTPEQRECAITRRARPTFKRAPAAVAAVGCAPLCRASPEFHICATHAYQFLHSYLENVTLLWPWEFGAAVAITSRTQNDIVMARGNTQVGRAL
jgi:hypothetical protein